MKAAVWDLSALHAALLTLAKDQPQNSLLIQFNIGKG